MAKIVKIGKAVVELHLPLLAETALEKQGIEPTQEIVDWLTSFMNYQFNHNVSFKKSVLSKANEGNYGRDFLYSFVEHWIKAKQWEKNPMTEEMKKYIE
mgnify:CR=1 FL=1|nr:hypothetical protein [uncultured Flavobacterium sp.]